MANHKKHHYVPRFYLKLFSADGRSINLFNIPSQSTVCRGGLANQCYRNYLYGKDQKAEEGLAVVEGVMSRVLRAAISDNALPVLGSADRLVFLLHVLMQHTRTAYSVDAFDEQTDRFMKYLIAPKIKEMNLSDQQVDNIKIKYKDSARFALAQSTPYYPLLIDLDWKLLRTTEPLEFITSDNPVVYYNQLMHFRTYGSNTGLAVKGLQIFFPIGPKHLVMLYDGKVYGVGSRRSEVIEVTERRDVEQLNRLQMVSALENIYFFGDAYPAVQAYGRAARYRRTDKSRMRVFVEEETENGRKELVAMSREDVRTDLDLSFVRILKPAKEWRKGFQQMRSQPAVVVRNEPLLKDHENFMRLVDAKRYKPGDFFKYVYENYQSKQDAQADGPTFGGPAA